MLLVFAVPVRGRFQPGYFSILTPSDLLLCRFGLNRLIGEIRGEAGLFFTGGSFIPCHVIHLRSQYHSLFLLLLIHFVRPEVPTGHPDDSTSPQAVTPPSPVPCLTHPLKQPCSRSGSPFTSFTRCCCCSSGDPFRSGSNPRTIRHLPRKTPSMQKSLYTIHQRRNR